MKSGFDLPFELPTIPEPVIPEGIFDLRDYGAVPDGKTLNTAAFRRAVEDCHAQGGGTLRVPAGDWLTGPIHLKSNIRFHLERQALVRFSTNFDDYLPVVFTRWEGVECYNYSPLIYAVDCENIAVTGEGVLDGQGQAWWHWKQLQHPAAKELYHAQYHGIPVEKRIFGTPEKALRPQFLQAIRCQNVLLEGVTFINGPMWTMHPVYCENVIVRNVSVKTSGPNGDGLNPDSCRNVLVEGCSFDTGDDCIAINSGMNEDGWRVGIPCENIHIRNCGMSEGHGAISIGSGMSGGVRNLYAHDCRVTGGDHGIRLKSMRGRGGYIEQVYFENFQLSGLRLEAILLNMFYGSSSAESTSQTPPQFRNIHIKNVTCESAQAAIVVRGLPEQPIQNVVLEGLDLTSEAGILCHDAIDLTLKDIIVHAQKEPLFEATNVTKLQTVDLKLQKFEL
ncbi:MAG: glycoside hydrolase family 28 protein [Anaerolineales bacterium]